MPFHGIIITDFRDCVLERTWEKSSINSFLLLLHLSELLAVASQCFMLELVS